MRSQRITGIIFSRGGVVGSELSPLEFKGSIFQPDNNDYTITNGGQSAYLKGMQGTQSSNRYADHLTLTDFDVLSITSTDKDVFQFYLDSKITGANASTLTVSANKILLTSARTGIQTVSDSRVNLTARDKIQITAATIPHDDDISITETASWNSGNGVKTTNSHAHYGINAQGGSSVKLEADDIYVGGLQGGISQADGSDSAPNNSSVTLTGKTITIEGLAGRVYNTWYYSKALNKTNDKDIASDEAYRTVDSTNYSEGINIGRVNSVGKPEAIDAPKLVVNAEESITVQGQRVGILAKGNGDAQLTSTNGDITVSSLGSDKNIDTNKATGVTVTTLGSGSGIMAGDAQHTTAAKVDINAGGKLTVEGALHGLSVYSNSSAALKAAGDVRIASLGKYSRTEANTTTNTIKTNVAAGNGIEAGESNPSSIAKVEVTSTNGSLTVEGTQHGVRLAGNASGTLMAANALTIKGLGKAWNSTADATTGDITTKSFGYGDGINLGSANAEGSPENKAKLEISANTVSIEGSRHGLYTMGSSKAEIHSDSLTSIAGLGTNGIEKDGATTIYTSAALYAQNQSSISLTGKDLHLEGTAYATASAMNDASLDIDISGNLSLEGQSGGFSFAHNAKGNLQTGSADIKTGLSDLADGRSSKYALNISSTQDFTWVNQGDANLQGALQGYGTGNILIQNGGHFAVTAGNTPGVYFHGEGCTAKILTKTMTLDTTDVTLASQDSAHLQLGSEEQPLESLTVISKGGPSETVIGDHHHDRRFAVNVTRDGVLDIFAKDAIIESDGHALGVAAGGILNLKTTGTLVLNGDVGGTTAKNGFYNPDPDSDNSGKQARINIDGGSGQVVVNGTITSYSYDQEETPEDQAQKNWAVSIKMAEGGTLQTKEIKHEGSLKEAGTDLTLNGAAWVSEGNAEVRNVESDGALIETNGNTIKIDSLTNGSEGTTVTSDSLKAGQLQVKKNTGSGLEFVLDANGTDQLTGNMDADRETLKNLISIDESDADYEIVAEEGTVVGDTTVTVNADGTVTFDEKVNTVTQGLQDIAKANFLAVRSQMNDLQKRMGDLRTMPAASGAWVRYFGGQNKYGSSTGLRNTYNTVQVGADARVAGNFVLGGTFAYTDDDGHLKNGSSDGKQYSFGVYGSWMGDDGHYVDVIAKRTRVSTDFNLVNLSGIRHEAGYHNWANSISVEAGHRFSDIGLQGVFLEPQAEFSYGYLTSAKYRTSAGATVKQGAVKTAVGRLGVAAGYAFPEKAGSAYFRASVLHDFAGSTSTTMSYKQQSRTVKDDLSGTWGEFAAGLTYNLTDRWSAYGEVQTTCGSPITNPWQVSAGVRMSF